MVTRLHTLESGTIDFDSAVPCIIVTGDTSKMGVNNLKSQPKSGCEIQLLDVIKPYLFKYYIYPILWKYISIKTMW
jgi:hypothetical protein